MSTLEVKVPSIGDFDAVPVIEIHVKVGDVVKADQALLTLESEKATMDVPSPAAGTIQAIQVKVGDRVKEGTTVFTLDATEVPAAAPAPSAPAAPPAQPPAPPIVVEAPRAPAASVPPPAPPAARSTHASPAVRLFARELGVDLSRVEGTGPRGRITKDDVQRFVKDSLGRPQGGVGLDLPAWPKVDFAKYGAIEVKPLARIRKLSAANLARNWVMIPHVTQHDEADITELESLRIGLAKEQEKSGGPKVTLLAFLMKAVVSALKKYPEMNSSLDGDQLVLKRYVHLGFAADTPGGLVVPVVRDADRKGILDLAAELSELARKAREGKLGTGDMTGGTFTISSLGGIGGSYFTPIINAPEVGILGVSKSVTKPVWDGKEFRPRVMLPLSLSYDHRVIDGAAAARFVTYVSAVLADLRRALL